MRKASTGLFIATVVLSSLSLAACSSGGGTPQAAANRGTVQLTAVRVGTPESVFKEAIITFIPDPYGTSKEKTQYLSRLTDDKGGQYVVQVKDEICYEVNIVHRDKTLAKEDAVATLKRLVPTNVTEEPVVSKALPAGKNANPVETYQIGNQYTGQLLYKDKAAKEVAVVTVTRVGTAM